MANGTFRPKLAFDNESGGSHGLGSRYVCIIALVGALLHPSAPAS